MLMLFGGKMWKEEPAIGENLKEKGRKITSEGKTGVNRVNKYIRGKKMVHERSIFVFLWRG